MYFNATKCSSLALCCLLPFALLAKNVKPAAGQGLQKPFCLVENKGQVTGQHSLPRADVQYKLSSPGMSLYVGNGKLHYQFKKTVGEGAAAHTSGYQVDVALLGANPNARVTAEDEIAYHENYYPAGSTGFTAHAYNKVRYKDVYPGIDWVLYVKDGQLEYDFVVAPGADVHQIQLQYTGATRLKLGRDGSLTAKTPLGTITENKPYSYETATGKKIASAFVMKNGVLGFEAAAHTGSLTIDPTVLWSTYYGGTLEDVVTSVKTTNTGITFIGGYTTSSGLAPIAGVYDPFFSGNYDAFAARLTTTGGLAWATYYGGPGPDRGNCIALDNGAAGLYMAGSTTSTGLVSAGVLQTTNNGGIDGFILKLNTANGQRLWGTYLGGTGDDQINSITCDPLNNVYVTGTTASTGSIATPGAYQTTLSGTTDAFVNKINSNGTVKIWGTYFGGSAQDEANAVAVDGSNNVVITGQTNSVIGIATAGAHQPLLSGTNDAFVAHIDVNGTSVLWSTYFGGTGTEQGNGIVCNGTTGNISIVGNTTSTTAISTANAHQPAYGGGVQDAFITTFDNSGILAWSTYYGGTSLDYGEDICFDPYSNLVIAGGTFSSNGISSPLAYQTAIGGNYDAFVAKLLPSGQRLWGTYFGNLLYDYAFGVACDNAGQVIIGGHTTSTTGIATTGVAQTAYAGGVYDGFTTRFRVDTFVTIDQPYVDTILCAGGTFTLPYSVNLNFRASNNFIAQLSNSAGSFAAPIAIGSVTANTSGTIMVTIPAGTPAGSGYRIRIVSTAPAVASPDNFINIQVVTSLPAATATANSPVCVGSTLNLAATAPYAISSYSWTGPSGFTSAAANPSITPVALTDAGTYTVVTSHIGCLSTTSTVDVTVNSFIPPTPTVTATNPACLGSTINFTAVSGLGSSVVTYGWTGPSGFTSTMQNPSIPSAGFGNTGYYYITDTFGGCASARDSILVTVLNTISVAVSIAVSPNDTVCEGTMVTFTATPINGGTTPIYQWLSNGLPVIGAISNTWSSSTLSDGEMISVRLNSSATCPLPAVAMSNTIKMNVINNAPIVYIIATPGTSVPSGTDVTFNSIVYNGGVGAMYQWQKNGVNIPGATNATYTLMNVIGSDAIKLNVTSTMGCAVPASVASNTLIVHTNVGIAQTQNILDNISLFPNPNSGDFSVKGDVPDASAATVQVEVLNTIGQVVYTANSTLVNNSIDEQVTLRQVPAGLYLLRVTSDGLTRIIRFTVSK
ncbi:MAG: SBBP repeat-containing protein [Bacteroidota bacterium]